MGKFVQLESSDDDGDCYDELQSNDPPEPDPQPSVRYIKPVSRYVAINGGPGVQSMLNALVMTVIDPNLVVPYPKKTPFTLARAKHDAQLAIARRMMTKKIVEKCLADIAAIKCQCKDVNTCPTCFGVR
jgi:hypothetical protein